MSSDCSSSPLVLTGRFPSVMPLSGRRWMQVLTPGDTLSPSGDRVADKPQVAWPPVALPSQILLSTLCALLDLLAHPAHRRAMRLWPVVVTPLAERHPPRLWERRQEQCCRQAVPSSYVLVAAGCANDPRQSQNEPKCGHGETCCLYTIEVPLQIYVGLPG